MKHRKFNVVDLVIIIVVAALIIFGCVKLLGSKGKTAEVKTTDITYTVKVYGVEKECFDSIKKYVTDKAWTDSGANELMASGAKVDGTITNVTSETATVYANMTTDGKTPAFVQIESDNLVDVTFTIQATVEAGDVLMSKVGTQEVRIGRPHIVKTEYIELNGTVLTVDWGAAPKAAA